MAIYSIIREFALYNEQYAIAQYQLNSQQSVNMQEKGRGEALSQFGFMNIEQRMSNPIPKFADCGQDMTAHEIHRLEQLLLEFGQRDAPSPEAPVTRPPLHRKRSQAYDVDTADVDKRPRLQWRKKEERDDSGRFAAWSDDRVPPPGVPKPPAPVTGTHTTSVYRPPPVPRAPVPPKEDFPKRNVVSDPPIAPKSRPPDFVPGTAQQNAESTWQPPGAKQAPLPSVAGRGSSSSKGSKAPLKGTPRGSVGRMMPFFSEDEAPRRGNIPKDLLGPPLQQPQIPKPPVYPPPKPALPIGQARKPPPPLPAPSHPPMPGLSPVSQRQPPRPPPPKAPPNIQWHSGARKTK